MKGLGDDAFMDRGMHGINYVNLFMKKGDTTVQTLNPVKPPAMRRS